MPKWIEERKKHLMEKNPGMSESTAWAVATQQGYATKEAPKGYGTEKGKKKSKRKYKKPAEKYEHRAKPGKKKKSKKKAELCEGLVSLANQLDAQGFDRLADHVTELLKIALKK